MKRQLLFTLFLFSMCPVRANTAPHNDLRQYLSRSEYFISWHSPAGMYESPNRKHRLRASFSGQAMGINPQGAGEWSFSLALNADDHVLYRPVAQPMVRMEENTIRFNHADQFTVAYVNSKAEGFTSRGHAILYGFIPLGECAKNILVLS
ncbi:hypothetical protein [Chitinophaga sancti]|uniref:hypothetical protein n=1 Tax=Chitinophaga sancti TaxID=1004 RepID=UPI003F78FC30